jgi:ribonuclease R
MSKKKGRDFQNKNKFLKGKLDITRSGIGYVIVEGIEKDIFIRPHDFGKAMHGDTVRISIREHNGKRTEGKVEDVLERKQTEFIGNLEVTDSFAFFTADTQKPMPDFYISLNKLNNRISH